MELKQYVPSEEQIEEGRRLIMRHGLPKGTERVDVKENFSVEQAMVFPTYRGYQLMLMAGENFAAPVLFNDEDQEGQYLVLVYGPFSPDGFGELPFLGATVFVSRNYRQEDGILEAYGVEIANLEISVRLVQGDRRSKPAMSKFTRKMRFDFMDFDYNSREPLRMLIWVGGIVESGSKV